MVDGSATSRGGDVRGYAVVGGEGQRMGRLQPEMGLCEGECG